MGPPPRGRAALRRQALGLAALLGSPAARRALVQDGELGREVTFFRHGQSVGNAGVWGAITWGPLGYRDGVLTPEGEGQVKRRVGALDGALLARTLAAEGVLTSPLRRAMATTVLLLSSAQHRRAAAAGGGGGGCAPLPAGHRWPPVRVSAELREKVKSYSEVPGAGDDGDPMISVREVGRRAGEEFFCDGRALDPVVRDIERSYAEEAGRTENWTVHFGGAPVPDDAMKTIRLIEAFKDHVLGEVYRSWERLLLVGHSGWSGFAFAHLMPPGSGGELDRLATGSRRVRRLNNAGVICARFHDVGGQGHLFEREGLLVSDQKGVEPGTPEFPNFEASDKTVLLGFPRDARVAQVVPHDTLLRYFVMDKVGYYSGHVSKRIYIFSYSESSNRSYMAWSDEWGEPRRHWQLGLAKIHVSYDAEHSTILLTHDGSRDSKIIAPSRVEFDGFKEWLEYCAFHAARQARGEEQALKERQAGIL